MFNITWSRPNPAKKIKEKKRHRCEILSRCLWHLSPVRDQWFKKLCCNSVSQRRDRRKKKGISLSNTETEFELINKTKKGSKIHGEKIIPYWVLEKVKSMQKLFSISVDKVDFEWNVLQCWNKRDRRCPLLVYPWIEELNIIN